MTSTGEISPRDLGVTGFVRIHAEEFDEVPRVGLFAHFNREKSNHQVGHLYAIVRILQAGMRHEQTGVSTVHPVLDLDKRHVIIAECVSVENNVRYADLQLDKHFQYSMTNIKSQAALEDRIVSRYARIQPHLSRAELLAPGVGFTLFRVTPHAEQ